VIESVGETLHFCRRIVCFILIHLSHGPFPRIVAAQNPAFIEHHRQHIIRRLLSFPILTTTRSSLKPKQTISSITHAVPEISVVPFTDFISHGGVRLHRHWVGAVQILGFLLQFPLYHLLSIMKASQRRQRAENNIREHGEQHSPRDRSARLVVGFEARSISYLRNIGQNLEHPLRDTACAIW